MSMGFLTMMIVLEDQQVTPDEEPLLNDAENLLQQNSRAALFEFWQKYPDLQARMQAINPEAWMDGTEGEFFFEEEGEPAAI